VTGNGKNHSLVFRIQPNWSRNVPYFEGVADPDNDPMDLATFADRAKSAAQTMANVCRIWEGFRPASSGRGAARAGRPCRASAGATSVRSPAKEARR
jgi:hypothetical protein